MTVRIVTDSNTMIPAAIASRLRITVVPLSVVIGGDELIEDATLDVADAYRRLRSGAPATTSAPPPGAFATAYRALAGEPVVSVHIGANYSGTVNAAHVGAGLAGGDGVGGEVRVVDTGTASFLAGCCVLAAAEAAVHGADADEVVAAAEATAAVVASVFTIAELGRAKAGGRLVVTQEGDGTPVLLMRIGEITPIGSARSADEAANVMFEHLVAIDGALRVGVGDADAGRVVDQLTDRLRTARPGDDVIRYVVGPTVAAHAGMGTFGVVYHPLVEDHGGVEDA